MAALEILLVEDNPGDVRLVRECLKGSRLSLRIQEVTDGVEALEFLRRQGRYAHESRPDLILLDLNLPRKDGREVLAEIKRHPDLKTIPVVILTSSEVESDVAACYERQANGYVTKPMTLDGFQAVVRSIENFWLATARLPSHR
jgi:CheY-like chemotaxis protein